MSGSQIDYSFIDASTNVLYDTINVTWSRFGGIRALNNHGGNQ